jgi:hypothetical protein
VLFYAGGNVGIGTTTPSSALDVVGDLQVLDGDYGSIVLTNNGESVGFGVGKLVSSVLQSTNFNLWAGSESGFRITTNNDQTFNTNFGISFTADISGLVLGDYASEHNGTRLIVDDANQKFIFENGNVGIGTDTPNGRFNVVGQNSNNYAYLLGGDSSISYNNFQIHLEDNSTDYFGTVDVYASPEEAFTIGVQNGFSGQGTSLQLNNGGETNLFSYDNFNSNRLSINLNNTIFIPSTSSRGGAYIGNGGMFSSDEAGLYDTGGDVPLAVFDAISLRAYYTPHMFVEYDRPIVSIGDSFSSLGGITYNYTDGTINIGRAETSTADGIEGIQVFQSGDNPIVKLGSTGFSGNGTNILVDDVNQVIGFNFAGGSYVFPTADGSVGQVLTTDGAGNITWESAAGGSGWSLTGDAGTTAGTNFIGTTDDADFVIKTHNEQVARFSCGGSCDNAYSIFLGTGAGGGVLNIVSQSNFIGSNAGYGATDAMQSNFVGAEAGYQALNAYSSNFFGTGAGMDATNASNSIFIGGQAGRNATDANNSNFIGESAGYGATIAYGSNFFGNNAGYGATSASYSNFFGRNAGQNATGASYSNFIGYEAGYQATSAIRANFLGQNSGYQATSASYSNFFGFYTGDGATGASNSNFLGPYAGSGATGASNSNFLGANAGEGSFSATNSNFLGYQTGHNATSASNSNFLGASAGFNATSASNSNFLGASAGYGGV